MTDTHTTAARRLAVAVALVLATTAGGASVAAAQQEEVSFVDAALDDTDQDLSAMASRAVAKQLGELSKFLATVTADESDVGNASTYADDLRAEVNQESSDLQPYANAQLDASTKRDVFRVCTHDKSGGHDTLYVVSNASSGTWKNLRAVRPSEFDDLNRSVDYNVSLDWYASRHADEELDAFVDKFVEGGGQNVSRTYHAKMVAKYGDSAQSGLWGEPPEDCPA